MHIVYTGLMIVSTLFTNMFLTLSTYDLFALRALVMTSSKRFFFGTQWKVCAYDCYDYMEIKPGLQVVLRIFETMP